MSVLPGVVATLRAALPADVKVYLGKVTDRDTPARFVIVTPGDGQRLRENYSRGSDSRETRVRLTITAVLPADVDGTVVDIAEWLTERCEAALINDFDHEGTRFMGADETLTSHQSAYFVADFVTHTR